MSCSDVSVVIPVRNRPQSVVPAILSALSQEPRPKEVIVIDDGSTDETVQVIEARFSQEVTLIKLAKSSGANVARQAGAEAATARYVAFLDSDDQFLPNKLSLQIQKTEAERAKFCVCGYVTDNGRLYRLQKFRHRRLLKQNTLGGMSGLLIDRDTLLKEKPDPKMPAVQDWELYLRLATTSVPAIVHKPLYLYKSSTDDRISTNTRKRFLGHRRLWRLHISDDKGILINSYHKFVQRSLIAKDSSRLRVSARLTLLKLGAILL